MAGHFGIKKICKLWVQKYYWPTLCHDVEAYVEGCDVCLASKIVCHKLYDDLQLLFVLTQQWKNLSIDFVTGLLVLINWKKDSYNSILIIVDWLIKMIHYKPVKITLNALRLAKVIINIVIRYHGLPDSIVTNRGSLFTSKFWSWLCYFLGIKQRLATTFYP